MMVVIQIPCFDEAATLPAVLADLPRTLPGVDEIRVVVIDDGSSDGTREVAFAHHADHVVRFPKRRGLAAAYLAGLDAACKLGADVIVNTDGDHQYRGADVADLIAPILAGEAELTVGDRRVRENADFGRVKTALQRLGSWVVRRLATDAVADAASGLRAVTRAVAQRTTLNTVFSYTLETLIQAGVEGRAVRSVPVTTNPATRPSRLARSTAAYVRKSLGVLVRVYTMHRPLRAFALLAAPFLLIAAILGVRWCWIFFTEPGPVGHVQSLLVAAIAAVIGVQLVLFGLIGDLLAANRRLSEEILARVREIERVQLHGGRPTPPTEPRPDAPTSPQSGTGDRVR